MSQRKTQTIWLDKNIGIYLQPPSKSLLYRQ